MRFMPSPADADACRRIGRIRALGGLAVGVLVLAHLWGLERAALVDAAGTRLMAVTIVGCSLSCVLLCAAHLLRALERADWLAADVDALAWRVARAIGGDARHATVEVDVTSGDETLHALVGHSLRSVRGSALADLVAVASRQHSAKRLVAALTGLSPEGRGLAIGPEGHAVFEHRPLSGLSAPGALRLRVEVHPFGLGDDLRWHRVGSLAASVLPTAPDLHLAA